MGTGCQRASFSAAFGKLGIQGWTIRRGPESHGTRHKLPLRILSRGLEHVYLYNFALDGAWGWPISSFPYENEKY